MTSTPVRCLFQAVALLTILLAADVRLEANEPEATQVFVGGTDGYHTYCIPSLICTPKGTLLAFCEGRKFNSADESPTDLVLRRSLDGGKTWLPMQVIVKAVPEAAADPTPVVDRVTGNIVLVYDLWPQLVKDEFRQEHMKRPPGIGRDSVTAWTTTSNDDGATWSTSVNITAMTKKPEWSRLAHGPGIGIQTRSGRLVIPCWRTSAENGDSWNHVIYSDDHGLTWQRSDDEVGPGINENQIVELTDGSLLLNVRSASVKGVRIGATSTNGGRRWSKAFDIPELSDPCCQASILRYTWADSSGGKSRILFSNPGTKQGRHTGTVRLSYDEGKTWPAAKVITTGVFGYSCLAAIPNGDIYCLDDGNWTKVTFRRFSLGWLTDGKDTLSP